MNLARASLKIVVANGISAIAVFVGLAVLARHLSPAQMGAFFLFQTLVGVFSLLADVGIRGAVEKRLSEGRDSGTVLTTALLLKTAVTGIVLIGIYAFRDTLNAYMGAELALWVALGVVLNEASELVIHVLRGELRVGDTAPIEAARHLVWFGVAVPLAIVGFGTLGVVFGFLGGFVVAVSWGVVSWTTTFGRPSIAQARSLLQYSRYNFVSAAGGYIYNWMDVAVLGLFVSNSLIGAYEYAWQITLVASLVARSVATTAFPQLSKWNESDQRSSVESTLTSAMSVGLFVSVPAFFGVVVLADPMLRYLFGADYAVAALVLVILMGEKVLLSVKEILDRALLAVDKPDLVARAVIITVVLNLVLNVALVAQYGIVGAAIATAVAFGVETFLAGRYVSRFVTVRVPYRHLFWYSLGSLVMVLGLVGYQWLVGVNGLVDLLLAILIGFVLYAGTTIAFPEVREQVVLTGLRTLSSGNE
ncbi:flippase [Halobium salinum]|uniref:Flippase n=1 Tax=Halobium salinum TaxID=1364940 RepID=A0ABD5PAE3_9EURY|nr:flippase [Halobium salinum]